MERLVFRRLFCHLFSCKLIWFLSALILCEAQVVTQDVREPLNTPASLSCSLQNPQEVLIVTWQKIKAVSPENMITFSENHGVVVQPAYKDKINITQLGLMNSTITFWNTTLEDEGCYKCLFNTFGSGKISGVACLTLSVQPKVFLHYKFSEDHLNITCSANARPAPVISWKVSGSGIENSTEILSHPNGTTSVTSILQVKDPKSQVGKEVICQVLYLGTVTNYRETVNKGFWFSVPLLLSIVSLVILLVLISILLYWKRRRNQDRASHRSAPLNTSNVTTNYVVLSVSHTHYVSDAIDNTQVIHTHDDCDISFSTSAPFISLRALQHPAWCLMCTRSSVDAHLKSE